MTNREPRKEVPVFEEHVGALVEMRQARFEALTKGTICLFLGSTLEEDEPQSPWVVFRVLHKNKIYHWATYSSFEETFKVIS